MKNDSVIEVVILEDGLHAKEVNRHGSERPKKYVFESSPAQHGVRVRQWEDAESRLRTFEITDFPEVEGGDGKNVTWIKANSEIYKPESKHKAEILRNGKIRIFN